MDILTDDQSFNDTIGREIGLDNPGLELPSDLEDIIFKGDGSMCLSDDVISHGVYDSSAYSTGPNGSCILNQNNLSGLGHSLIQGHGHLGDPQDHRHINGLADQISQQLHHQQQLQQQYHSHQQQLHHHLSNSNSYEHEGRQQQQICHQNHHQQQQQQNSSYCSISGQPQYAFDVYEHPHLSHTSLPDSPPDSGSEPYSPTDGNIHHQAMTDLKSTIPGSLPTIPQSMYLCHGNRLGGMPPNKAPPAYIGEPSKLNHHLQGPPLSQLQQQQQDQQQQGQRVPMSYSTSVGMGQHLPSHQISPPLSHSVLPANMGSMSNIANQVTKKRKYSDSPTGTLSSSMIHGMNGILNIKQEPPAPQFSSYFGECSVGDDDLPPYDIDANGAFIDSTYQVIKWQPYSQSQWAILTDGDLKDLPTPNYRVDADKGFNFSVPDEAFMESQNQNIKIEQSQSDRSKKSFHPVKVDLPADQETKVTVGRLHFSETTSNNMRKKGKPNPDQRYFLLVVSLHAHCGDKDYMLVASVSDRIIVRASNPGQFDSDVDVMWQKGQTQESVYHMGKVGVNTDHPEEALTVHGNMRLTGHLTQPSDMRAKNNIEEINPKNQLENVSKLRIYKYTYREDYAAHAGIPQDGRQDTGVLAQEILDVLPDAVQTTGDIVLPSGETIENFLVVNKDRIYMENVGAVKELCKLTDNLEVRIDQLEKMNKKLGKLKRFDSLKSTTSSLSAKSISTASFASSVVPKHFTSNSGLAAGKNSYRNSHHSSGRDSSGRDSNGKSSSHAKSLKDSKSTLSLLSWPFKNRCNNWFKCIIVGLILLMLFCLTALACLYILEVQKPDSDNSVVSATEPDLGILQTTETSALPSTTASSSAVANDESNRTTVTANSIVVATSTGRSTTVTTSRTATLILPSQPHYTPILPPYPPCTEGYCEKLCCPPPHEDDATIASGGDPTYQHFDNNNSGPNGEDNENSNSGEDVHIVSTSLPVKTKPVETVIVNLPEYNTNTNNVNYNVINSLANNPPSYSVVSQNGNRYKPSPVYTYRSRRGADDAPRPVIKIAELNYTLGDVFCEMCQGNNFSYFVLYNASFGYEQITLEFQTSTMSYMALCNSTFMWRCPPIPPGDDTEVVGPAVQQTHNASWTVKIGSHYRTILNFRVIHSLLGKSVTNACSIQNSPDYVVMSYNIRFQRQC